MTKNNSQDSNIKQHVFLYTLWTGW